MADIETARRAAKAKARRVPPRTASAILRDLFTELSKRNVTIEEVAHKLRIHPNNVSGWRTGATTPNVMSVEEMASAFGMSLQLSMEPRDSPPYHGLLNDIERRVMAAIVEVWNLSLMMPKEHDDDIREIQMVIHQLQEKILARPARRAENGE